jgi:hypothetical protein
MNSISDRNDWIDVEGKKRGTQAKISREAELAEYD